MILSNPSVDCGPYIYTLTSTPPDVTAAIRATPALQVSSNNPAVEGSQTLTVQVSLQDYPTNPGDSKTISVNFINCCEVPGLTLGARTPTLTDMDYYIGDGTGAAA